MKKFIYFFLFFLVSLAANSQVQRPAGNPSPNSPTGYSLYGWSRADSGYIWKQRDTFPAKFPTIIWHTNGNFYKSSGNGGAWSIFASSTAGTVSSVSGNAPISVANGTTTPTISADTSYNGLATKKWLYKTVDSLGFIKLNISDTAAMLLTRLKVSDTAYMLSGYLRESDTSAMLSNYVPTFRTIGTNAPLFGGGNLSANRTLGADTGRNAAQLVTGGSLTAVKDSLVALIASSGGGTVLSVATTDGYGVISSVANASSTPNISLRVDTVSISTRDWRQKGIDSVQNNLTSGLALKLNLSDTAAMLSNRLKISDTATMLLPFMQYSDTSNMLSPYRRTTTKITNSDLANSTISGISLGSNLQALTFGQYLQVGASSYNGSVATTITTNGTSTNAGSTLVARDINGDFSARNISATLIGNASSASTVAVTNDISTNATYYPMFSTVTTGSTSTRVSSSKLTYNPSSGALSSTTFIGNLTGNASTATVLQTARTINGVAFDGSADITISAAVGNSLTAGYGITGSPFDGALARTWVIDTSNISTKANVTGALVAKLNIYDTAAMLSGYKTYYPRTAISAGTGISYNAATGVITNSSPSSGGTVTSVATNTGSGITGGTITSTGTIAADTTILSTKANVTGTLVGYTTVSRFTDSLTNVQSRIQTKQPLGAYITLADSSTILAGRWLPNRSADSIAVIRALANTKGTGSVTSVATGVGLSGGTITTSGTISADTTTLSTRAYVTGQLVGYATTGNLALKLNISDTAAMLTPFVQYSDTANQMSGYQRLNFALLLQDTAAMLSNRLRISDTLTMLSNRLKISDTSNMLSPYARTANLPSLAPYLLKADSLSGGYTTWALTKKKIDSIGALKVNYTDTAAMLSGYKTYYPRTAISAGTGISYNAATGVITNSSPSSGGTVTSVATNTGSGITGGTITGTGTIAADTTVLSTKANVTALLGDYVTIATPQAITGDKTWTGINTFLGYFDKDRTDSSIINILGYATAGVENWNLGQKANTRNFSLSNVNTSVQSLIVNYDNDNITLARNLIIPFSTDSLNGVIYKSTYKFLHDYKASGADGESVFLGRNAGNFTMSTGGGISSQSSYNTGIGVLSLNSLTTGWSNVGVGYRSLGYTTSGKYNTGLGVHALDNTTIADRNTAVGHYAAFLNETGAGNTVVGASALRGNVSGSNNSFFGLEAGYIAGNVSYNSAFGYRSLYKTEAGYNSAFGMNTLLNSTTAQECVAVGFAAGQLNTTGSKNVFIGTNSGSQNLTGSNNVFLGHESGYHETGDQKLFIDNQGRANEADARLKAMIYGVFNTAVSSQFLNFNVNKLTINSGTTNQNSLLNGTSLSYTRVSDAAPVVYFSKNTDLGSEGTANVYGYDGIQFRTQGPETVKGNFSAAGDFTVGATSGTGTGALYSGAITSTGAITGTSIVKSGGTSTQALIADGSVQTLASGTYTPTLTGITNVTSTTATVCQYLRVGNSVTVSGKVRVTGTTAGTTATISISLPFAQNNFANSYEAGGAGGFIASNTYYGATLSSNSGAQTLALSYIATSFGDDDIYFTVTYQVK